MKTTVELPKNLLLEAKRKALETKTTLRNILERALRQELTSSGQPARRPRRIRWVTSRWFNGLAGFSVAWRYSE